MPDRGCVRDDDSIGAKSPLIANDDDLGIKWREIEEKNFPETCQSGRQSKRDRTAIFKLLLQSLRLVDHGHGDFES